MKRVQAEVWAAAVVSTGVAAWGAHGPLLALVKSTVAALAVWLL